MCNPIFIPIAAAVLTTAGSIAKERTANNAISAQNKANRVAVRVSEQASDAERVRQRRLEEESSASVSRALAGTAETAEGTGREAETVAALDEANARVTPDLTVSALPGQISGDTELAKIIAGEINSSSKRVGTQVKGLNTLAGLQSAFGGLGDLFGSTGSAIQTTNSKRRSSLGVSGLETSIPAASVRPGSGLAGDLLTLAGQVVGVAGGAFTGGANSLSPFQSGINRLSGPSPVFSPTPTPRPALPF